MPDDKLEKMIEGKVKPIVESAMQKYLGVTISEIEHDISDKLKKSPLLEFDVNTHLPFKQAKKEFKRAYIRRLLQLNLGNVAEVARIAGLDRRSIHRLMQELQIEADEFRRVLMRGSYVKQTEIKNIIESSLEQYRGAIHPDKYESLYDHAPDISRNIVKELPERPLPLKDAIQAFEKKFLRKALREADGNISRAAKRIGLRFETMHRKLKALGLI